MSKKNTKKNTAKNTVKIPADIEAACKAAGVKPTRKTVPVEAVAVKPAEKPVLTAEEKRAKRNEYARKYYEAHREKLIEASRRSHAKSRANASECLKVFAKVCDAIQGVISEQGDCFDNFYKGGTEKLLSDIERILGTDAK